MRIRRILGIAIVVVLVAGVAWFIIQQRQPRPGHVLDEALLAGRTADTFPAADEDYFHDMDGGMALTSEEIKGRNTWIVWTAGDDRLWDVMTVQSLGALDFLKTLSDYPGLAAHRDNRWEYLGLVNEPCFEKATGPDPNRFGLWLDKRSKSSKACPPDPFENEKKYPGVRFGARGKNVEAGSYYGYASGVVGLRLFPNPAFDEKAAKRWDPERYYKDPSYYNSRDLIRPYRVGMSCGFCHVGPNPLKPPLNPDEPKWSNLSSDVGAQYFWVDRVFDWQSAYDPQNMANFIYQLFHTSKPGTLDTSLISTDNINNPRTMNAVYQLGTRLAFASRWGKEKLAGGGLDNRQFNDYVTSGPLTIFFQAPDTVWTPHVLKDGSDSVGAMGALNRVYLNIGTFSEEWLLHFNPLVGGKTITPITIAAARKNSAYFKSTEAQTFDMALFLVKSSYPHHLKDAPGGAMYLTQDAALLNRGKTVFAETCARCHSSKLPAMVQGLDPNGCAGPQYLDCWNKYWAWTKTEDFKSKMRPIVFSPDFLKDNALSADFRVPVTLLHTNACSPLATNALGGNIWDNFSSQSYKDLPSVGEITWYDPYTGEPQKYQMPAGGRGYTRVPSLVSVWSTAPFLLNNALGPFEESPSVDARMRSFQGSIEQMLWPQKRDQDSLLKGKTPGTIQRTTVRSYLRVPAGYLPDVLQPLFRGGLEIGPIPKGTPVDLLANLNPLSDDPGFWKQVQYKTKLARLVFDIVGDLSKLPRDATDEQAQSIFANLKPRLLELSKCRDFVVNRGHYFGTGFVEPGDTGPAPEPGLSDQDKRALIEFLKTF
jgi:hypothetical protein